MARKTLISYKYSDASNLRNRIIEALGEDATYYKGETSESPDLTDRATDAIKNKLKDMIFDTSVTIVIISPEMKNSKWIEWEIEYSLKKISRSDRTSHANGIVGVIMKHNGSYVWFKYRTKTNHGCISWRYQEDLVHNIISKNRFNQVPLKYICPVCETVEEFMACYISYVEEDDFLANPTEYIENAFEKSENDAAGYVLAKEK